jgi:hypothetical protein
VASKVVQEVVKGGIVAQIFQFIRANLPAAINAVKVGQNLRLTTVQNGNRVPIVLDPGQLRQWLQLFCEFGLLPAQNCGATAITSPDPAPAPGTPTEPWYKQLPKEAWIAGAVVAGLMAMRMLK